MANTTLVAASAIAAGNDFFDTVGTATGTAWSTIRPRRLRAITGATALSGAAGTDSLSPGFAAGDTITVNGTPITFVASGATGNELNVTDSVQTLLSKIDSITGTSTPSTIDGGVVEMQHRRCREPVDHEFELRRRSQALGFSSSTRDGAAAAAAGRRHAH